MTRFVFLAASRGQIGWGPRVETGKPERRLREEAEGGTQVRQEGAWPIVSEEEHLPKKLTAHWMGAHCKLLWPLRHSAVFYSVDCFTVLCIHGFPE